MPGAAVVDTWVTVVTMFWHMRKELMCLIDGDDALVDGQDDAHINLRYLVDRTSEVAHGTVKHLLGTFQVKPKVALNSVAELLLEVNAAVLAVGVRKEMNHISLGNVA